MLFIVMRALNPKGYCKVLLGSNEGWSFFFLWIIANNIRNHSGKKQLSYLQHKEKEDLDKGMIYLVG